MLLSSYSAPTGRTAYQLCVTTLLSSYSAPTGSTEYQLRQVHRCTEVDSKESFWLSDDQPSLRLDRNRQKVRPRRKIPRQLSEILRSVNFSNCNNEYVSKQSLNEISSYLISTETRPPFRAYPCDNAGEENGAKKTCIYQTSVNTIPPVPQSQYYLDIIEFLSK